MNKYAMRIKGNNKAQFIQADYYVVDSSTGDVFTASFMRKSSADEEGYHASNIVMTIASLEWVELV